MDSDNTLNKDSSFSSKNGFAGGLLCLNRTTDAPDILNAINTPAETISFRYVNGTNVEIVTIIIPATNVPYHKLPDSSTCENIAGNIPSSAIACWRRGCAIIVTITTIGKLISSPTAVTWARISCPR
mmetsp:Transcript_21433/g.24358  ORF Transcript_21433/g.24358 Transcript_21433/m.24358 type:complete len:127 (+) Transcript_21433:496-876(+)